MRELDKPIGRVFRRLRLQRFLGALVWCLAGTLLLAALAIGAKSIGRVAMPFPDWAPFAMAGGLSLAVAALVAAFSGPSRVDAAVAIDRAFHLNERLSSVLTLPTDLRGTPAGQALVADTLRHVGDLDIGAKFGLHIPRRAWVPVIPAALSLALMFVPAEWFQKKASADGKGISKEAESKAVTAQTKALNKAIAQKREAVDKAKFPEAEKLFAQIEKATEQMAKSPNSEKDKTLVELNKLTDAVKDRQKVLGEAKQIQKQLQQLKETMAAGPADQFARDLAKGDFQKAANELKTLQEKLASGKMTEREKTQLREQLSAMKEKLDQLANLDERKKQIEDAKKNGTLNQEQYDQQMAKLNEQAKDLQKMKQLAQQMQQAQQAMQAGDMQKAAEALGMSQDQLAEMAKDLEEMEMLEGSLAEIQDAKNAMNGEGMNQLGMRMDGDGMGMGNNNGNGNGNGLGRGRGRGDRPEAPDETGTYKTQVKMEMGKGAAIKVGQGPPRGQTKGQSVVEIQDAGETGTGLDAEALSNQKVPKAVQKHVTGYFDGLRQDK